MTKRINKKIFLAVLLIVLSVAGFFVAFFESNTYSNAYSENIYAENAVFIDNPNDCCIKNETPNNSSNESGLIVNAPKAINEIDRGYIIKNFSTVIDCSAGRKAKIKETITVEFLEHRHGIYRDLVTTSGEDYSHLKVTGADFSVIKNTNYIRLKIGDSDRTFSGEKVYTISYEVTVPKIKGKEDSLYYNVVPYGFDTTIESFDVAFIMPTAVAKDKIVVTSGSSDSSTDNSYADYYLENEKTIIINNNSNELSAFHGVTLRVDFPKGTLKNVVDLDALYIFLVSAVFLLIAIIMFFVYGKDDKTVEVVGFTPPRDMPPSDAGYLIDGNVEVGDITSLFFYWASLGCVQIHEEGKKVFLVKVKDLPATCEDYERNLFRTIFAYKEKVDIEKLGDSFVTQLNRTKTAISSKYADKLYTRTSKRISKGTMIASVLFVVLVGFVMDFIKLGTYNISVIISGLITGLVTFGYYLLGCKIMKKIHKMSSAKERTASFVGYGILGVAIALLGMAFYKISLSYSYMEGLCIMLCPVITCWIAPYIHKRTDEYNELLGELLGFRNFILYAEKDKLEELVKDEPEYFYNILPYANVLGVSNVLEDKFRGIPTTLPYWYYTDRRIDILDIYIYSRISRNINSIIISQVSAKAARSAGNVARTYSGGIRGGGGFGGGGGGSW